MTQAWAWKLACLTIGLAVLSGCESVPALSFVSADAGDDAPDDAPADASASDGNCPASPPPGASACCGAVGCEGLCSTLCGLCASKCTAPGEYCCARTNSVSCLAIGLKCH